MARSLPKKIRFEVFKRDGFVCQYCGKTPPAVVLEVDHIIAVVAGGSNHIDNLTSACFDCNRGKGAIALDCVPQTIIQKMELIKERESQLKAFKQLSEKVKKRQKSEAYLIAEIFHNQFPTHWLKQDFTEVRIVQFLQLLPFPEVESAMEIACRRIVEREGAVKYFCGICWKKIKGGHS